MYEDCGRLQAQCVHVQRWLHCSSPFLWLRLLSQWALPRPVLYFHKQFACEEKKLGKHGETIFSTSLFEDIAAVMCAGSGQRGLGSSPKVI